MKKSLDTIKFESRSELEELMKAINKYIKQNPSEKDNRTLERLYDLLDTMHMEW